MKRLRLNRWLISIVVLAMLFLVFKPEQSPNLVVVETTIPDSDFFMEDIVIHQFDENGLQINTLAAKRMEHSSNLDVSILQKPLITFGKSALGEWRLSSEHGKLLDKSSTLKLENNVKIEEYKINQPLQTEITTDSLLITLENNSAKTDDKVFVKNPHYKTEGIGLAIDFIEQIFTLKSDVSTQIYQTTIRKTPL